MSTETIAEGSKPALARQWDQLLFGVKRSIRYHTRRRCFFERIGFAAKFCSVFFGGGTAVAALLKTHRTAAAAFGLLTAAFSASDLIIGYAAKARLYHDLSRKFIELEKEMLAIWKNPTEADLIAMTTKRLSKLMNLQS